jgi:hypothetical protein
VQMRVTADHDALAALGIQLSYWGPDLDCVDIAYYAPDEAAASHLLRVRYGPTANPIWLGESSTSIHACPFASWTSNGRELKVFYAIHRWEVLSETVVTEHPGRVLVGVRVVGPLGRRAPFTDNVLLDNQRGQSMVRLNQPVGDRVVIDVASGDARPEWVEPDQADEQID